MIPAIQYLEMAKDQLAAKDQATLRAELHEFGMLGARRRSEILASVPPGTSEMGAGYLLGIETARVLAAQGAKP